MRARLNEHIADISWRDRPVVITVVGCGGTGAQVAMGLPYLHQALLATGHPFGLRFFLADGDTVSETNCVRQPFARSELGLYKSVVLINRLNLFWGVDWEALPHHVTCGRDLPDSDFLISCVDTRSARADIARIVRLKSKRFRYWLDCGNLADRGQFVLGQPRQLRSRCSTHPPEKQKACREKTSTRVLRRLPSSARRKAERAQLTESRRPSRKAQ